MSDNQEKHHQEELAHKPHLAVCPPRKNHYETETVTVTQSYVPEISKCPHPITPTIQIPMAILDSIDQMDVPVPENHQ